MPNLPTIRAGLGRWEDCSPQFPSFWADELPDHGLDTFWPLGLVGPGAGEDGGAPDHARAALACKERWVGEGTAGGNGG